MKINLLLRFKLEYKVKIKLYSSSILIKKLMLMRVAEIIFGGKIMKLIILTLGIKYFICDLGAKEIHVKIRQYNVKYNLYFASKESHLLVNSINHKCNSHIH